MARIRIGDPAPDFELVGVDGKQYSFKDFSDKKVLVVMFTCNHCPYVQAYEPRLVKIQSDYGARGVALVAINSNSTKNYPDDSFDKMVARARERGFNFSYLRDEDQSVVTAYGAQYTPEIFVLDAQRRLRYHGRIDDNYRDEKMANSHDLREVIEALLEGRQVKSSETQAFGCTIKWASH